MVSTVAIVGAGPAGSSLAIRLAEEGFAVILIEREKFPRQKLCGEFISPECLAHFDALGVADRMLASGGDRISETIFYERGGRHVTIPSEWFGSSGALSLSRAQMDLCLLDRAREVGVEVREETRTVDIVRAGNNISGIRVRNKNRAEEAISADLFIDATGRSAALQKLVAKAEDSTPRKNIRPPFVAFKTHLRGVELDRGRCEIYSFPGGYGGLSYVEGGVANFCFLMKAETARKYGGKADPILSDLILSNNRAAVTLRNAAPVFEWLAVTVDKFGRKELCPAPNLLTVGDAAAFIDPFTGSGMLLAFETAEVLGGAIVENRTNLQAIGASYQRSFDKKFSSRLSTSGLIRYVAFTPSLAAAAIRLLNTSSWARAFLTRATRQTFSISPDEG
jgi:flavin-dependent dehydrogenase